MQDEALYKCHLLLFEDPALEAQHRRVVLKGYLSLGGIWEVCQSQPLTGKRAGKVARGADTPPGAPWTRRLIVKVAMGCHTETAVVHIAHCAFLSKFSKFFYNLHDLLQKKNTRIYCKKKLHDLTIFLYASYIFHTHCILKGRLPFMHHENSFALLKAPKNLKALFRKSAHSVCCNSCNFFFRCKCA